MAGIGERMGGNPAANAPDVALGGSVSRRTVLEGALARYVSRPTPSASGPMSMS
jgi:hypothetical protein